MFTFLEQNYTFGYINNKRIVAQHTIESSDCGSKTNWRKERKPYNASACVQKASNVYRRNIERAHNKIKREKQNQALKIDSKGT